MQIQARYPVDPAGSHKVKIKSHPGKTMHKADKTGALLWEFAFKLKSSHLPRISRTKQVPSKW